MDVSRGVESLKRWKRLNTHFCQLLKKQKVILVRMENGSEAVRQGEFCMNAEEAKPEGLFLITALQTNASILNVIIIVWIFSSFLAKGSKETDEFISSSCSQKRKRPVESLPYIKTGRGGRAVQDPLPFTLNERPDVSSSLQREDGVHFYNHDNKERVHQCSTRRVLPA